MKHLLTLLATTQNHNRGDLQAAKRIADIYQRLKEDPSPEEADRLIREALKLKKTPSREIEELLSPSIHLFCFPYAGGNKWIYENWQEHLPPSIRIHPIEYPGRGAKTKDKLASNLEQILACLERDILDLLHAPNARFAFFGHSLGAIIAFELSLVLRDKYAMAPVALFLSGSPSPDTATLLSSIREQEDSDFIDTLHKLNGIPPSLLESQEFKEFFLPILRSDFSLMDRYGRKVEKVPFPLVLFGSDRDPIASLSDMKKWAEWSEQKIELYEMEGDHFFIHEPKPILERIAAKLSAKNAMASERNEPLPHPGSLCPL